MVMVTVTVTVTVTVKGHGQNPAGAITWIFSLHCMTCSRVDKLTVFLTSDICFYFTNRLTAGRLRFSFPWKLNKPLATARKQ